jgi:carbonic anhydrase/acetyltransferase-like protein (isoleucine patch superfamily)
MLKKLLFVFSCIALVFPRPALAKVVMENQGTYELPKGEILDDDLFVGAESVVIDGTVNGNVYVGTGSLKVRGIVNGDLVGGAGNAELMGTVKGDVYLGGGNISLSAQQIGGTLALGAGTVELDEKSSVAGSLLAGAGSVTSRAKIGRSAMIGAASVELDGPVGKEARLAGSRIHLGDDAAIKGDVTYALGDEKSAFTQAESATIAGKLTKYEQPEAARREIAQARTEASRLGRMFGQGWLVLSFIGMLIMGGLCLWLFGHTFARLAETARILPGKSFGIGLLLLLLFVPAMLVLLVTVVGIPLIPITFILFLVDIYFAKLVASYALGDALASLVNGKEFTPFWRYVLGLVTLFGLHLIPGIGWFAWTIGTMIGLGAIWLTLSTQRRKM